VRDGINQILLLETAEKGVRHTFCHGSGGVSQLQNSPKIGGYRGFISAISTEGR